MTHLMVDAHEDLAYNMLAFGRDYSLPVAETRRKEIGSRAIEQNGDTLLGADVYKRGRVAFVFSTLFAAPKRGKAPAWENFLYSNPNEAYKLYSDQIDVYERLFDQHPENFTPIRSLDQFEANLKRWQQPEPDAPTGLITLMEGAECVRSINELEEWWERGVRLIGLAWKSTRFCGGTGEPGPLTDEGREMLRAMAPIGFTLDLSHMDWESALQSLDMYEGQIVASHANALNKVKNGRRNRFLTDEIIDGIIQRNGVIGVIPYNTFLDENWKLPDPRSDVPLSMVADQIDYICQRAGSARHAAFGTDFDGGFGLQHIPDGLDTIADLQLLDGILGARGYSQADIDLIFGGNWVEILRKTLPK